MYEQPARQGKFLQQILRAARREEEGDIEILFLDLRSSEQALTPSPALSLICEEGIQLNAQRPCTLRALTCWSPFPGRGSSRMCTFTCRLTPALFHQARGPPGDSFEHISSVHLGLSGQGHVEPRKRRHRLKYSQTPSGGLEGPRESFKIRGHLDEPAQKQGTEQLLAGLCSGFKLLSFPYLRISLTRWVSAALLTAPGVTCVCVRALLPQTPFPQWVWFFFLVWKPSGR